MITSLRIIKLYLNKKVPRVMVKTLASHVAGRGSIPDTSNQMFLTRVWDGRKKPVSIKWCHLSKLKFHEKLLTAAPMRKSIERVACEEKCLNQQTHCTLPKFWCHRYFLTNKPSKWFFLEMIFPWLESIELEDQHFWKSFLFSSKESKIFLLFEMAVVRRWNWNVKLLKWCVWEKNERVSAWVCVCAWVCV